MSFPDLLPAKQSIKVDASVTTTSKPKTCEATVGAPAAWDGPTTPATPGASAAPSATANASDSDAAATEAFKVWVTQFAQHEWTAQYKPS